MNHAKLIQLTDHIIAGGRISRSQADELVSFGDLDVLCDQADRICRHFCSDKVDSCSIINARSGLCPEDCKWCAQSTRHNTGCDVYESLPYQTTLKAARRNESEGIARFSLVTSGRALSDRDVDRFCDDFRRLSQDTSLYLCASMGLLTESQLQRLREAGVRRYHCNMETSSEYFRTLCSTHTPDDKKRTIAAARRVGLEVCSGGIIGMGETTAQRIDFAFELAELDVDSVPLNILNPIPGTPLEDIPLISEEDIIRTAAIFRFILPDKSIRFAGGRKRLSHRSMLRMMRGGVNGVLMGDMLTTVSNTVDDDRKLFAAAGWKF
ncbi:MAG: biotin synthase BioB [Muribaculaceae bacterium]|nr:biotin synthase BioB [Muribaculaceae bacterium]